MTAARIVNIINEKIVRENIVTNTINIEKEDIPTICSLRTFQKMASFLSVQITFVVSLNISSNKLGSIIGS